MRPECDAEVTGHQKPAKTDAQACGKRLAAEHWDGFVGPYTEILRPSNDNELLRHLLRGAYLAGFSEGWLGKAAHAKKLPIGLRWLYRAASTHGRKHRAEYEEANR